MASEGEEAEPGQRWSSFSDYESVVETVADRVEAAIDARAHITSCDSQMITMSNNSAVEAKKALLGAGDRLKPEVRHNKGVEPFDEIWERWHGEDGHIAMLQRADFIEQGSPSWLHKYVDDLTTAAWELGYLQAGKEEPAEPDDDSVKVREVID